MVPTNDEECLIQRSKIRELEITIQNLRREQDMDQADREIARLTRIAEESREHISEAQWYSLEDKTAGWDARPTGAATPASHAGSNGPKLENDCDAKVGVNVRPSINTF